MSGACEYKPYRKEQEEIIERKQEQKIKKIEIFRLAGIATVMIFVAWMHLLQPTWLANIVVAIAVIVCGYPLYRESLSALRKGRVNMELSMVIAIVASLTLSQFLPAIAITFFALLSEFIEGFIIKKGRLVMLFTECRIPFRNTFEILKCSPTDQYIIIILFETRYALDVIVKILMCLCM